MASTRTRIASIALIIVALGGLGANSAQAHTQLVSSTPADGAQLVSAPRSVEFRFDEPLLPSLDTVSINDELGANVYSSKIKPTDTSLEIEWPATLPAGTYQVAYRVVSADGHPVTGAITFSFGNSAAQPSVEPTPIEDSSMESSFSPWAMAIAAILLAGSIAAIYVLVKRRR
ncbi:MAG: copper resistance protein CopC [Actinomycetota bacterium]|nr:copper resistance protein CopC [Actinomycetota bacterium]MDP2287236.1 copper resistance protein CopC [Actinomycetota bacterium]